MTDRLASLINRFRQQQKFAASYSPLYSSLFGTYADWMVSDPGDPLVRWLVRASEGRAAFDVTNLLAAGLHREVLKGKKEVSNLAVFYPSINGRSSTADLFTRDSRGDECVSPHFVDALRESILARQNALQLFIQTYTVQTNETGRGIAWLLPVSLTGWNSLHVVDMGASAGLNLVAEQRAFRFMDKVRNQKLLDLGLRQAAAIRDPDSIRNRDRFARQLPDAKNSEPDWL